MVGWYACVVLEAVFFFALHIFFCLAYFVFHVSLISHASLFSKKLLLCTSFFCFLPFSPLSYFFAPVPYVHLFLEVRTEKGIIEPLLQSCVSVIIFIYPAIYEYRLRTRQFASLRNPLTIYWLSISTK